MRFRSIRYYVKEAFKSIKRNSLMSLACIITVASCIFIVSLSYCLAANINYILKQVENELSVAVYLDDEISADEVTQLYNTLKTLPYVESVEYTTPQEILEKFGEKMGGTEFTESFGGDNPMPRTLTVYVTGAEYTNEVIDSIRILSNRGIEKIRDDADISGTFTAINKVVNVICVLIIAILAVISVVLITNTIKLTVNSRKNEINIMKYVGATDWFIRGPFVVEGILIGLIGAIIPLIIFYLSYGALLEAASKVPLIMDLVELLSAASVFVVLSPVSILMGVLLGVLGSVTSIRRHLKV